MLPFSHGLRGFAERDQVCNPESDQQDDPGSVRRGGQPARSDPFTDRLGQRQE
jgi:hypothetical protein